MLNYYFLNIYYNKNIKMSLNYEIYKTINYKIKIAGSNFFNVFLSLYTVNRVATSQVKWKFWRNSGILNPDWPSIFSTNNFREYNYKFKKWVQIFAPAAQPILTCMYITFTISHNFFKNYFRVPAVQTFWFCL